MKRSFLSHTPEETEQIAAHLAEELLAAERKQVFIALVGEMGVGKTAFARGFAAALGADGVHSPTYTVVNEYKNGKIPIFHFDLYRLADEDELYAIGFDDYLARDGYILCEWSENAADLLPDERMTVTILRANEGENARQIEIKEG